MNPMLYEAITQNDQLQFKQLLDKEGESILNERTAYSQETTLHLAAKHGHAHIVYQIVNLQPNLAEALNKHQETPLHDACRGGSLEVLEILLEAKPWVLHWPNDNKKSALFLACQYGHGHLLKRLMKEINIAADFSLSSSFAADLSCLRIAVSRGYAEFIRELIEACPSLVEKSNEDGLNLLHYACEFGESDMARMLLILNPDLALSYDNHGFAPLHHAAMQNNSAIFKEFEAFAPFAFKVLTKIKQETVFHLAVQNHQFDAFISLIKVLGDSNDLIYRRDQEGNRLLHLAVYHNSVEIAEYLINKATKQQLQTRNYAGLTALGILEKSRQDNVAALHLKDLLLKKLNKLYPNTNSGSDNEVSQQDEELNEDQSLMIQLTETLPAIETRIDKSKQQEENGSWPNNIPTPVTPQYYKTKRPSYEEWDEFYELKKQLKKRRDEEQDEKKRLQTKMQEMHIEGLQNARNTINIIAILISTVTFTGCLSPPGGFFQGGPDIGKPVLGQTTAFKVFAISNDVALFLSLGIVLVQVSIIPFQKAIMQKLLALMHKILWLAVSFLATAYIAGRWATTLQVRQQKWMFGVVLSICCGFLGMVFVGLGSLLINSKLKKSKWRKQHNEPTDCKSLPIDSIKKTPFSIDSDIESQSAEGYYSY